MAQTEKRERRGEPRFGINLDGNVRGIDPSEGIFQSDIEVLNISLSGVYMKIHHYVDLFTKLDVTRKLSLYPPRLHYTKGKHAG